MSILLNLLAEYRSQPIRIQRAVAAIVGAAVGDAATRPVHWLYDRELLESTIGTNNPEFWPTNLSPFYIVATGRRSCYNDEGLAMLQSLPALPAIYDKDATRESLLKTFAPDSEYAAALARRRRAYDPSQRTTTRDPVEGPWQQGAVTTYLEAIAENKEITGETGNAETDGFCLSIPLIARLSALDTELDFPSVVANSVRTLSAHESAVAHSSVRALILRDLIRFGESNVAVFEAFDAVTRRLVVDSIISKSENETIAAEYQSMISFLPPQEESVSGLSVWGDISLNPAYLDAVQSLGKPCGDPGNFKSSLLAIVSVASFAEGIRRNILGGGCNCSRANFVGACLGASYGLGETNGIPLEWLEQTDKGTEILSLALKLFAPSA